MKNKTPLSEPQIALINQAIDGELTDAQRLELEQLLTSSIEAREFSEQLILVTEALSELPDLETPVAVKHSVLQQIKMQVAQAESERHWLPSSSWLGSWLNGLKSSQHWQTGGVAIAVAAVLAISLNQFGDLRFSDQDQAAAVGTLIPSSKSNAWVPLDSVLVDKAAMNAKLVWSQRADAILLELSISAIDAKVLEIEIDGNNYSLENSRDGNRITFDSPAKGTFSALLSPLETGEKSGLPPFSYRIYADKQLIFKGNQKTIENK